MGNIANQFAMAFRDFVTDGVASSGPHEPIKEEIRAIGPLIEVAVANAGLGALVDVVKATRADLDADLAHAADTVALVYADATDANNDLYIKVGASGSGSWTLTTILHDLAENLFAPQLALAEEWAENPEDVEITGNPGSFSAKHYAAKASEAIEGQLTTIATAGNEAAASITALGLSAATTDNTLAVVHETFGISNNATLATNVGVSQVGRVNGTDFTTGQEIAALQWRWACASDTATVEITIWARDVAGATTAGTINNPAPIATHDTLVGIFTTTPAALGITPGTSTPALTAIYRLATPFTAQAGRDYIFQFRNLNASAVVVNCGISVVAAAAGNQRRAGFRALTATPTTFTNINAAGSTGAITLYRRVTGSALAATDATNRLLLDRKQQETLAAMNARNIANLRANAGAFPNVLSVPANFWGDSLTADATGSPAYRATDMVDDLSTGTVNNYGVGGETLGQITARVSAASSTDKGGLNFVMGLANDLPASKTVAAAMADYATCAAAFTNANYVMAGTWTTSLRPRDRDVWRELRATYGAKAWDAAAFWARYGAFSGDFLAASRGIPADGFRVDAQHSSIAGINVKGHEWAALTFARNGGAPYVHDEIFGIKQNDAAGTAIGTVRALGTALNFQLIAGNEDAAITIDRTTGAITRTANSILLPYREAFVEAENRRGVGRNGRIIIVRQMDGTNPQSAVQIMPNGAAMSQMPSTYAPADGTQMTLVLCARLDPNRTTGQFLGQSGTSGVINQNAGNQLSMNARSAAASLGNLSLNSPSPSEYHFYFWSVDTVAGTIRGARDEVTSSAAVSAGNLALSSYNYFFNNSGNTLPFGGFIKMFALYNAAYDVHDSAVRAAFYDSATRLPKDIGDGTAGGTFAAPLIYLRGMAGDYLLGKNFGTGGDLHTPIPIGLRHVPFLDVAA